MNTIDTETAPTCSPRLNTEICRGDSPVLSSARQPGTDLTRPQNALLSGNNLKTFEHSLIRVIELIKHNLGNTRGPFSGTTPEKLSQAFVNLDLDTPCRNLDGALNEIQQLYLNDAVYFHHPRYMAHLNCPITIPSVVAELIQASVNTSVDTWDQSAGATLIEQSLVDWTAGRIGLGPDADGVFTSGGTQSNLMAMLLARDNFCQRMWHHNTQYQGLHPDAHKLRIFCSELSHFSVQKAAALLGLGYGAVIPVPHDQHFRMDVSALTQAVQSCKAKGDIPMAVVATVGTTDFGSIDPIPAIADLCKQQRLWLHADAAYGCGLLVSNRHRHLLKGIEQADSVTVDYHKSFMQPVACSALIARNKKHLSCVTWHAEYLNPLSAKEQGTPNLVDKSLQTTRRFDALKLWLTLRTLGADGIGEAFDKVIHLARVAYLLLLSDDAIEAIHQPQLSALVFRFRPAEALSDTELDEANRYIRSAIMASGQAMIAATQVKKRQYLKFTLLNPETRIHDLHAVLNLIRHHGHEYLSRLATDTEHTADKSTETKELNRD